ncbi:hypothetical protein DFJ74DRAFT_672469 [Hyaloraphidium curvatum]|nr:hypothetical protein DFJ74DRAFT_672469 [Hyaloraphidium curvatum]
MGRLDGKVAVITGCGHPSGIGAASARRFADENPRALVVVGRRPEGIKELAEEIRGVGVDCEHFIADAASEPDTERLVAHCLEKWGRLDVFFANAGHGGTNLDKVSLTGMDLSDFQETLNVNILHPFLAIKHATPAMCVTSPSKPAPSGSVIVCGSVAGTSEGKRISADYSASKAAAHQLVNCASYQLGPRHRGVRFNTLAPGFIATNMTGPAAAEDEYVSRAPGVGRVGRPEEMADVALFLASDESSYVNGQVIIADGGLDAATALYVKQRKGQAPRRDLSENFGDGSFLAN